MGTYKDRINYVDHDFNSTTLLINSEHKGEGLDTIAVEKLSDRVTVTEVADGMAILNNGKSRVGTITFECLEASATNDYMQERVDSGESFPIALSDDNAPNMKAGGGKFRVMEDPVINRGAEAAMVEWVCITAYLDGKTGAYKNQTPVVV